MKLKRISLRFNLENESDRRAWERLQDLSGSKNKAIISAINGYFEQENDLAETIRAVSYTHLTLPTNSLV